MTSSSQSVSRDEPADSSGPYAGDAYGGPQSPAGTGCPMDSGAPAGVSLAVASAEGCPAPQRTDPRAPQGTDMAVAPPPPTGKWSTGRRSVLSALHDDPYWPTRLSATTIIGAARGSGRPGPLPPGPKGLPVVGSMFAVRRNPFEFMRRSAAEYGDVFRFSLPLLDVTVVQHPDLVSQFMDEPTAAYSMSGPGRYVLEAIGGATTPAMEGERFRQRRKMLLPMFSRRHMGRVAATLADEFVARIDQWSQWADTGEVIDLQHAISQVTLPAFLRAMFSSSITEQEIHETDIDIRMMMALVAGAVMMAPMPHLVPFPGRQSLPRSVRRIIKLVRRLIKDRRAHPLEQPDLLSILLGSRYDDGSPLSELDLVLEVIMLIGGGYETVVSSLSWTLALLLSHPEHLARLYEEIDTLGGAVPTQDDLVRLPWAKACFDEGQRLQGHPLNPRFAMRDGLELGGYPVPKYSLVGASLYAIHRDPRWWPEPDRYDPNRFIDEALVKSRPRLAFMPFGSGPHHCVGTGMAYMNAQFLLTTMFQRYRISLLEDWVPEHKFSFSVTVKGGLPVTFARV